MKISRKPFGLLPNGKKVHLYTLKAGDLSLSISTLGATWTSLRVPSARNGKDDVLLGFSSFDGFLHNNYFGVTVGRFANRIGGAQFTLRGKQYNLPKNEGENSLHGGRMGFSKRLWKAEAYEESDGVFVRFELKSHDGDEGYPGTLHAAVSYGLTKTNELLADYQAKVDAPCPLNLTNHAYFNLAGESSAKDILSTEMKLHSSSYLEVDNALIPTGKILPVEGTPFDFRSQKPIGEDIGALLGSRADGYDHCFVIDDEPGDLRLFAEVHEPYSGRSMRGFTTQPAFQFFSGNNISAMRGKIGSVYEKHAGFCLETQHFPDSPNRPEFPSTIFGPERNYNEKTVFAFAW